MGVTIKITDGNGRSFPDMASAMRSAADEVKDEIWTDAERAARRETCAVHNQKATVKRTRDGIEIGACCQEFSKQTEKAALDAM
jgi:hypothetical protein